MTRSTRLIRPLVKIHGGKYYDARRIVSLMPDHEVYCEPFLGGGSVLLNKPVAPEEHAGDLNGNLIDVWGCVRSDGSELVALLGDVKYEEKSWRNACEFGVGSLDNSVHSVAYIVKHRMSRGGLGKDFAWSDRLRGGKPGDVNAWETFVGKVLPAISDRVRAVEFSCRPAVDSIAACDGPGTLHYLDPPYCPETRTHRKSYDHEMTIEDHEELIRVARACRGTVMISGYMNVLYMRELRDWRLFEWSRANHSGQGKSKNRRVECLWMNR